MEIMRVKKTENGTYILYKNKILVKEGAPVIKELFDEFLKYLEDDEYIIIQEPIGTRISFAKRLDKKQVIIEITASSPDDLENVFRRARSMATILARNIDERRIIFTKSSFSV